MHPSPLAHWPVAMVWRASDAKGHRADAVDSLRVAMAYQGSLPQPAVRDSPPPTKQSRPGLLIEEKETFIVGRPPGEWEALCASKGRPSYVCSGRRKIM